MNFVFFFELTEKNKKIFLFIYNPYHFPLSIMDLSGMDQSRRTLGSYANPITAAYGSSICTPPIKASSFELNPQLIIIVQQNCQYSGLPQEEPTEFLAQFLQIADTVHDKEVDQDVYRLLLFPFAVKDQAKRWLNNQPTASIKT